MVPINVPFLTGVDAFKRLYIQIDFTNNKLYNSSKQWEFPLIFLNGSTYIRQNENVITCNFTKEELLKIHRRFMYPSAGKISNLLRSAFPLRTKNKIKELPYKLSYNCEQSAEYAMLPFRFRTSTPKENIVFNREIEISLIWLDLSSTSSTPKTGFKIAYL